MTNEELKPCPFAVEKRLCGHGMVAHELTAKIGVVKTNKRIMSVLVQELRQRQ